MENKEAFSEQEVYEKNCHNVEEYVQVESTENNEGAGHAMLYIQDPSMEGPQGEQHYVTIVQDGQTYAIPAADYEAMTARQAMQEDTEHDGPEGEKQHMVEETEEVSHQPAHPMESVQHIETETNIPEQMEVATDFSQDMVATSNPNNQHTSVVEKSNEKMQIVENLTQNSESTSKSMNLGTNSTGYIQSSTNPSEYVVSRTTEHMRVATSTAPHMQVMSNPMEHMEAVADTTKALQVEMNPISHTKVVTSPSEHMNVSANLQDKHLHTHVMSHRMEHARVVTTAKQPPQLVTTPSRSIQMVAAPTKHGQVITNANQHILVRTNPPEHVQTPAQKQINVPVVSNDVVKKTATELQKQNLSALSKLNMSGESKIVQRPISSKPTELLLAKNYNKKIYNESSNVHKNNQPEIPQSVNQTPLSYKRKLTEKTEYGGASQVQNSVSKTPAMKTSENISHPNERLPNVSMKWMTGGTTKATEKPILPRVEQPAKPHVVETDEIKKSFKPIRVDNWGIFLLSRLQAYFHKKEFCDLTLRFPSKNAQIKVHKLVINACTDFFITAEKEGKVTDGCIDMPSTFTPETVAPIIRFMYTGKLEIKDGIFSKLHDAANSLEMSVLTKLMDAQLNTPSEPEDPNRRRKRKRFDDPVQQIRKIKKIERRVMNDELKAKRQARLDHLAKIKTEEDIMERTKLPGKKLPIWKKRFSATEQDVKHPAPVTSFTPLNAPAYPYKIPKLNQPEQETSSKSPENVNKPESSNVTNIENAPQGHQSEIVGELKVKQETSFRKGTVSTTYGKSRPTNGPKFPRKLQEIQQHLMFEKIMRTGTKNNIVVKNLDEPDDKQLSVEEIKELMIEQKQRTALGEDLNDYEDDYENYELDDDYIDDEDLDEYQDNNEKESVITQINETKQCDNSRLISETPPKPNEEKSINLESQDQNEKQLSRPILKHSNLMETPQPEAPRKSVRFSLRACPENVKPIASEAKRENIEVVKTKIESETQAENAPKINEVTSPSKVECKKSPATQNKEQKQFELDVALEEFSRVAEQEEKELNEELAHLDSQNDTKNNKATLVMKKRGRPPKPKFPQAKDQKDEASISLQEQVDMGTKIVNPNHDQANVISEVLKKYPGLFKDNKHVKIKVLTKDPITGKESMQYITLKTQPGQQKESLESSFLQSLKNVPKVMYTGKRGRPKKIKPGMHDPHAEERKKIEDRITNNYTQIVPGQGGGGLADGVGDAREYPGHPGHPVHPVHPGLANPGLANFSQVEPGIQTSGATPQLDPSSEAEAFSTVASGIAASLGLVEQQQHHHIGVPSHQPGQQHHINHQQHHINVTNHQAVPQEGLAGYHGNPQDVLVDQGQIQLVTTSASADQLQIVTSMGGQRIHYVTNPQHLQFINAGRPVMVGEQAEWVPVMDAQAEQGQENKEEKRKVVVQIADDWDTEDDE